MTSSASGQTPATTPGGPTPTTYCVIINEDVYVTFAGDDDWTTGARR